MKPDRTIFQKSHLFFVAFFLLMLAGFWLTYFTKILDQENYRMHLHGITLIVWCTLFKSKPAIHARYMICTVFPMFTAIFDRIIDSYFPSLLPYFPDIEGPVAQVFGLTLGDSCLFALCIWDWRSHKRINVFPIALIIHLIYHFSVLNFYKFEFWRSFCNWFFHL
ncbi:MAG: hypothetical protein IPQ08_05050 [Chitinophagaceae bacterium]|nr:hypothetical protein [Chitinophagaceae bacterium]